MASGDLLCKWLASSGSEGPTSNYMTADTRNGHPVVDADTSTQEALIFSDTLPDNYGGGGITARIHYSMTSATSSTFAADGAFERIGDGSQDIDSDSFATAQASTPATVPGTSGFVDVVTIAFTDGAQMDSVVAGELFRFRLRRDVANDAATGDAEIHAIELYET